MYTLVVVQVLLAIVSGQVDAEPKALLNEFCKPRPSVVATDGSNYRHFPYFITLDRCVGSVGTQSPAQKKCVAKQTKEVEIHVMDTTTPTPKTAKTIKVENHTSCTWECATSQSDCKYEEKYDEASCSCKCPYEKAPRTCGANKYWNKFKCGCECRHSSSCGPKKSWSDKTCGCICNAEYAAECSALGRALDQRTCTCREPKTIRTGSTENNRGDAFGTQAFWYYVVIGEFVVLMVLFDAVLFCKKAGVVYNLTRSCRAEHDQHESAKRSEVPFDYCCVGKPVETISVYSGKGNAYWNVHSNSGDSVNRDPPVQAV